MKIKILIFIILFIPLQINALEINSKNAILYNLNNGEIIYEKNSDETIKIASMTKIMTSIVAIENIDNLTDKIVITNEMLKGLIEQNAAVVGFKVGDVVTYEDLLYGALLPSGADATQALAISICGSVEKFVNLMNEKAKQLNLNNTYFTNTSGLDDDNNYSTVKDVATILKYALSNDKFAKIFQTRFYTSTNGIVMTSTLEYNSIKYNLDTDYIIGAKTGTTNKAGLCLASITEYNGINYLLVTAGADKNLNKPLNIIDSDKIYKYYFENYEKVEISDNQYLFSIDNKYHKDKININSPINYTFYKLKEDEISYNYNGINEISIFTKDNKIGEYEILLNNEVIKQINVYKPKNIEFSLLLFLYNYLYILIPSLILIIAIIVILKYNKKHKITN